MSVIKAPKKEYFTSEDNMGVRLDAGIENGYLMLSTGKSTKMVKSFFDVAQLDESDAIAFRDWLNEKYPING